MQQNIDIKSRIYGRISASTPGRVWALGDFLDFGPRDAVSKALQRLEKAGQIRRIEPGRYDRPKLNRLTGRPTPPDYRAVVEAIARQEGARMLIDGMTAANDLGLTTAVPGRVIVHTDKRRKPLHLGNLTVVFKLTSASKLIWADRPAMRIVQALRWLKPKLENAAEREIIKERLRKLLKLKNLRADLAKGFASLPVWMQKFLGELQYMEGLEAKARSTRKRAKAAGK